MLFDIDGDGRISWDEYKIILALLAMSVEDLMIVFDMLDTDASGYIEEPEFTAVLDALMNNLRSDQPRVLRKHTLHCMVTLSIHPPCFDSNFEILRSTHTQKQLHMHVHMHRAARAVHVVRSGFRAMTGAGDERPALMTHLFGRDGKGRLTLKQFETFLMSLHSELRDLEFKHYDQDGSNTICGRDFVLSIVASGPMSELSQMAKQVDKTPADLLSKQIFREDFMVFELLCRRVRQLSAALSFAVFVRGGVTREELARAFKICVGPTVKPISPTLVDLCFHAFGGHTEDGFNVGQFLRAVRGRAQLKILDSSASVTSDVFGAGGGFFSCIANCIRN